LLQESKVIDEVIEREVLQNESSIAGIATNNFEYVKKINMIVLVVLLNEGTPKRRIFHQPIWFSS
jgi:hypothetical protein